MTSIRKAMALGTLALALGLVGAQPAQARGMAGLLSIGSARPAALPAAGSPIGRPPVSQPIPGPVISN